MQAILQKISKKKLIILGVTTLIIFWLLFKAVGQGQDIKTIFANIRLAYLIWAAIFGMLSFWLGTLRWYCLLKIITDQISFKKTFGLVMASWPLGLVPGKIGDFARAYPIRHEVQTSDTIGSLLLEKLIDVVSLLILMAIGLLGLKQYWWSLAILGMIVVLTISLKIIKLFKLHQRIANLLLIFPKIKNNKKLVFYSLLSSLANWFVSILMIYILFLGFQININLIWIIAYFPLAILAGALPLSLGGLGTRESVLVFFLSSQAEAGIILWTGLTYSFIAYFLYSFLALPFGIKIFSGHQTLIDKKPVKNL